MPGFSVRQHAPNVQADLDPRPGGIVTLSNRDRVYTLVGILLALFLGALDQTIVSTALPKIAEDLRGLDRFAWVATAYLLASTVLVPIYGKLADMYSRKTIELIAISIFLAGSFLCGLSGEFGSLPLLGDGMTQLILFRALQGVGGAGLFLARFHHHRRSVSPQCQGTIPGASRSNLRDRQRSRAVGRRAINGLRQQYHPWYRGLALGVLCERSLRRLGPLVYLPEDASTAAGRGAGTP